MLAIKNEFLGSSHLNPQLVAQAKSVGILANTAGFMARVNEEVCQGGASAHRMLTG